MMSPESTVQPVFTVTRTNPVRLEVQHVLNSVDGSFYCFGVFSLSLVLIRFSYGLIKLAVKSASFYARQNWMIPKRNTRQT